MGCEQREGGGSQKEVKKWLKSTDRVNTTWMAFRAEGALPPFYSSADIRSIACRCLVVGEGARQVLEFQDIGVTNFHFQSAFGWGNGRAAGEGAVPNTPCDKRVDARFRGDSRLPGVPVGRRGGARSGSVLDDAAGRD